MFQIQQVGYIIKMKGIARAKGMIWFMIMFFTVSFMPMKTKIITRLLIILNIFNIDFKFRKWTFK